MKIWNRKRNVFCDREVDSQIRNPVGDDLPRVEVVGHGFDRRQAKAFRLGCEHEAIRCG